MTQIKKIKTEKIFTGIMLNNNLRDWLSAAAKKNSRSLSGQIVFILTQAQEGGGNAEG